MIPIEVHGRTHLVGEPKMGDRDKYTFMYPYNYEGTGLVLKYVVPKGMTVEEFKIIKKIN